MEKSFVEHFKNLQAIADKMQQEEFVDLDEMVSLLVSASESYEACRIKIEGVKKLTEEKVVRDSGLGD